MALSKQLSAIKKKATDNPTTINLTPALANELWEYRVLEREPEWDMVVLWAFEILSGQFELTHFRKVIQINKHNNELLSGSNELAAVIIAGKSCKAYINFLDPNMYVRLQIGLMQE